MRFGRFELDIFSDGTFKIDGGAMFGVVPKVLWSKHKEADDLNRVTMDMNCVLIRDADHVVLVETGAGSKLTEKQRGIYGIERPPARYAHPDALVAAPGGSSFPSGHTATSFACATVLSFFVPRAAPAFYLLALAIGYSRIYVGVHWPLDVLGGAVLGVAVGQSQYPTPVGRFEIVTKQRNPWWYPPNSAWAAGEQPVPPGPGNPLGTRWMGISAPGVGLHGTPDAASIGYSASHGCIRMRIPDAEWLFVHVRVGSPVWIIH